MVRHPPISCQRRERPRARMFVRGVLLPIILAALFVSITSAGCGGCRKDPAAQAKEDEEQRKKDDEEQRKREQKPISIGNLEVQPRGANRVEAFVKPGHWSSVTQEMRANLDDFVGGVNVTVVQNGRPLMLDGTPFWMTMSRPIQLTKGRAKNIESMFFVPPTDLLKVTVERELRSRGAGGTYRDSTGQCRLMKSFQYYFVVISDEPRYTSRLQVLDSIDPPYDDNRGDQMRHYRIVEPSTAKRIPLHPNPLTWTSIAYILWDGVSADRLTEEQQAALVDWLHWGGQLIISGPDSLDTLGGSFLGPYLPARSAGVGEITAADVEPLSRSWTLDPAGQRLQIDPAWSGVKLEVAGRGKFTPGTGELVAEGRVGRGRIAITAFRLDQDALLTWSGFDNFFNGCLLGRPARRWSTSADGELGSQLNWAGPNESRRLDARLISKLRYFTRDEGIDTNWTEAPTEDVLGGRGLGGMGMGGMGMGGGVDMGEDEELQFSNWKPPQSRGGRAGIAAWNDYSEAANRARGALRVAAGVTVPGARFVLAALAVYLFVLVPMNWMFFHALGRIEWAWIAAPLIALAGTLMVVWQAQLDIGFVRAQTEIAVLEVQCGHPRGHLTRYTAIYSSLGTTYDFKFDDLTALAAPFPTVDNGTLLPGQSESALRFVRHQDVQLKDLPVTSSSTRMVHSEQMFDLGGPIRLGMSSLKVPQLENLSTYELQEAVIVRRPDAASKLEGCWIGRLGSRASATVAFTPVAGNDPFRERRREVGTEQHLDLGRLQELALSADYLVPGETRLVARVDVPLPGITVTPKASQQKSAVLVVAHLDYGELSGPAGDLDARPVDRPRTRSE